MIDLHTHLLPGIDDGSSSMDETIMLLKKAQSVGVSDVMLTSHFARYRQYTVDAAKTFLLFKEVLERVKQEGLIINLHLGNELDYEEGLYDLLKEGIVHTLGDSNYVLLDFGLKEYDVDDVVYELIVRGYKPIIAHPERYRYVHGVDEMKRWRKTGALLQMNAHSLFSKGSSKKQAKLMIKDQLVDLVASDVHRDPSAYDDLVKCKEYIVKKIDEPFAKKVFEDNPRKVIMK